MNRVRNTNIFFLGLVVFYITSCFFIIPYLPNWILEGNWSIVMGQMIIAIPVILYLILQKGKPLSYISFKKIRISDYFILFFFTMFLVPVISLINTISMMFVENYLASELDSMNSNPLILNLILVALIPAFVEEITFRGIIYGGYKGSKTKYAILASALLFGLFHMNVNQLCYAFVMAVVFGLLYEATGSILSTIFVHFIFNSNSVVLQKLLYWYEKMIIKLAEQDDSYKEAAKQITESANQTTSYADMTLADKFSMISSLLVPAFVGGLVAFLLLKAIAKRNNREVHLKKIIYSFVGKEYVDKMPSDMDYEEEINGTKSEKIIDVVFIAGVVLCIAFIVFLEL